MSSNVEESAQRYSLSLSSSGDEQKQKNTHVPTVSSLFKQLVNEYEVKKPQDINIIQVSKEYGIQHRRVYDFFNFLTSLGVCQSLERRRIAWVGLKYAPETLANSYAEIECSSLTQPFSSLFSIGPSPSLGSIATKFVCLYFYLGVDTLSMRSVSTLFHHPKTDIKSLERRMYLVLSFLEIIGIVTHTSKRSEYRLTMNQENVVYNAFYKKKSASSVSNSCSVDNLLSKYTDQYIQKCNERRLHEFRELIG